MAKRKKELKQWVIRATLEFLEDVLVEAEDEEQAMDVFNSGSWELAQPSCPELIDWKANGKPELNS